ncbi:MAG: hypothetical protein ACE365_00415 [Gammaproteobacteria bacterium]
MPQMTLEKALECLRHAETLKEGFSLNLSNNNIHNRSARALAQARQRAKRFRQTFFQQNSIGDNGARALPV